MASTVHVIGHRNPDTDSVCSAIAYAELKQRLGHANVRPARAGELNAETRFVLQSFDVPVPEQLADATGQELILVDHNERAQAVPNIEHATIHEIWEHHRLGDLRPPTPIVFHCEPVGATATLIGEQYFLHGLEPSRSMAGMLLAAIWSDTVNLRSPTTSDKDRHMVARLEPLAGVDAAFGEAMIRLRSESVAARPAADLIREDHKEFEFAAGRVGVGQIEVLDPGILAPRSHEIREQMRALRESSGLLQIILMVTDITAGASELWVEGERLDLFERGVGPLRDGALHFPGCMSRKKQVIPLLERAFSTPDATANPNAQPAQRH
ncbi:manganese-dependent inorganic pyrophosphatase [Thioalkalivibrio sp. ALE17]|uniref:manganese-dependent inorganic pyrophosphatase n=1 Tax=Thioalkalivibrio sp. ALE17 TaxID=1158173 RepID=UPI0003FA629A|nr:manganese-dependent inorganic pyrophosphatase [Thioalkalivibrio sp. ALE17]